MTLGSDYAAPDDSTFIPKYQAHCHCRAVHYAVCADPLDAKLCHCNDCKVLHGAPMQWAAIFRKRDVRLLSGLDSLRFYRSDVRQAGRVTPCKVSCSRCGTPIADEGRRMWLAFPGLFDFGPEQIVPPAFLPTCHIFYGARVRDVADNLPKWAGHKGKSARL